MPATMQLGALLEPGLRSEASQVYWPAYNESKALVEPAMWTEGTSDKFQEIFGFLESPNYFQHWPAETPPPSQSIGSQRYVIVNRDFAIRQYLPRNWDDDQTGTAMQFARAIALTYAVLPVEEFYQYILNSAQGATAPMPTVPNSADGNALYITTTRYGVSGGNGTTQTGASTVQQIITDIAAVRRRMADFQNTKGRPYWNPAQGYKLAIYYGTQNMLVMDQARAQTRIPFEVTGGANGTGQTPTNILKEAGYDIDYYPSQRITTDDLYCFAKGIPDYLKPIWRQVRKGYTEWQGNFVTSDYSRDTGQFYVQGDCREGLGSILAIATVRVQ